MKYSFSKKDTLVVKGIAIIFLVFYHCLSKKGRLLGYDISFAPLSQYHAFYIFDSMNVCVGTFAILSAFGLMRTINYKYLKNGKEKLDRYDSSDFLVRRVISLIGAFFIPYIICTLISIFAFNHNPYGEGSVFVLNMLCDMLGIAGLLGTPLMVETWWYMSFALIIIGLVPITVNLYKKHGLAALLPYLIIPILLNAKFYNGANLNNMTRWLFTIPLGIMLADSNIYEKMKEFSITKNKVISKIIKFVIWTVLLLGLFWLRKQAWGWTYLYYVISSVLPMVFIYWLYEFVCGIKILNSILAFIGKYSSDIFFMHTFIRAVWFPDFTYSLKYWYAVLCAGISLWGLSARKDQNL